MQYNIQTDSSSTATDYSFSKPQNFHLNCGICQFLWTFYVAIKFGNLLYWLLTTFIFQFISKFMMLYGKTANLLK